MRRVLPALTAICFAGWSQPAQPQAQPPIVVKVEMPQTSRHYLQEFGPLIAALVAVGVALMQRHLQKQHLRWNGSIVLTEPNEVPPAFYVDKELRGPTPLDLAADQDFCVSFDNSRLQIAVNGFSAERDVTRMPKVFGPGLIRFQSFRSWMSLVEVDVRSL